MAKVPYPDQISDPRVREILSRVPPLNLLRLEAHAEGVVEAIIRVSDGVLNRTSVDPALKLVAFMSLCGAIGSRYEYEQLAKVAHAWELPQDIIAAAWSGSKSAQLTVAQRIVARLAEELAVHPRCTRETFDAVLGLLGHKGFVELVVGIGFYLMQSRVIETFEIEAEAEQVTILRPSPSPGLDAWRNGQEPARPMTHL